MKFQQIRGATIKVFYGKKTFLIDPFFAPKDFYPPLEVCHFPDRRWPTAELPETAEKIKVCRRKRQAAFRSLPFISTSFRSLTARHSAAGRGCGC